MKYLLILLLGVLLGALAYRELEIVRSPGVSAPVATRAQSAESGGAVDHAPSPPGSESESAPFTTRPSPASNAPTPGTSPSPGGIGTGEGPALLLPVQGITYEQLTDTFTDSRSQGRSHDAIDIMAPAGTPVLAVADGNVEKLFTSDRGGLTLYQFEPSGRLAYYYAHLQRYADGIAEGQGIRRGQVIGYVGSTGNASPDAPHLHFAVFVLGPERRWWEGQAINPYPLFKGGIKNQAP